MAESFTVRNGYDFSTMQIAVYATLAFPCTAICQQTRLICRCERHDIIKFDIDSFVGDLKMYRKIKLLRCINFFDFIHVYL